MDCSLPPSSIHGIFQARVLEWIAISFSRGPSQPRYWTQVSCIVDRCFTVWAAREVLFCKKLVINQGPAQGLQSPTAIPLALYCWPHYSIHGFSFLPSPFKETIQTEWYLFPKGHLLSYPLKWTPYSAQAKAPRNSRPSQMCHPCPFLPGKRGGRKNCHFRKPTLLKRLARGWLTREWASWDRTQSE